MRTIKYQLLDIIPCRNVLGEGVQWNDQDNAIWWTDIQSAKLYRYHPDSRQLSQWDAPERIGCFAFMQDDSRLLVAFASGIAWWDLQTGQYEWIARPEADVRGNRLNDGRVDRQGRFWVGGIVEERETAEQTTGLYCLDHDLQLKRQLTGLTISNGLCWSPDSSAMFHADSPSGNIDKYPFDAATGTLGSPQVFVSTASGIEPDGACVDAEGNLWSAQWGSGSVQVYTPEGQMITRIELPVSQPTCVAFGGPGLSWLMVTSARKGLDEAQQQLQPEAGNLFIFQTNARGLPECRFRGSEKLMNI